MTVEMTRAVQHDSFSIASFRGEIDLSNAADLTDEVLSSIPGAARGLIVDLTAVSYLDSAGIRMLFDLARQLEARRQAIAVAVAGTSPLRGLLKVANIHEAIPICQSTDECIEAMGRAHGTIV